MNYLGQGSSKDWELMEIVVERDYTFVTNNRFDFLTLYKKETVHAGLVVIVPNVTRFGEKDKQTKQQNWEDVPHGTALEGLFLPTPPGKDYRLLKVLTQPATADQIARLGNDRAPVVLSRRP